jgi:prepilin-type N-terminal cleavage/methylation domain-containing protein
MNKSFTLIEILVVIVVIGVLSAFILVGMSSITNSANIAKGKAFANSLRNSLLINLVSEWKFDVINNPSVDQTPDSWNTNAGTLKENLWSSACDSTHCPQLTTSNCVSNSCLYFDGSNDCINIPYNNNLNPREGSITVSSWVRVISLPSNWGEIFYGGATGGGYGYGYMLQSSGNLYYEIYGTTGGRQVFYIPINLSLNKWTNIVMVFDASNNNLRLYSNGYKYDDRTLAEPGDVANIGNPFKIGSYHNGTQYFLNAYFDEMAVFTGAMPASKVKEQYYLGINSLLIGNSISMDEFYERLAQLKSNLAIHE